MDNIMMIVEQDVYNGIIHFINIRTYLFYTN